MGITAWTAGQKDTMHDDDDTIRQTGTASVPDSPVSTGCRNHRPEFDEARTAAISWSGREGGIDHWSLLEFLETDGVSERFGLGHRHIDYIRAAFRKLQQDDFAAGTWPPVVWITKTKFASKLRVSPRTISSIEQDLARAGLIYWLDTASRRRDGRRCPRTGRILWAYGVNFAPNRQPTADEFVEAANWTRSELGISPSAWGQACRALTRVGAALAVVVIAARYDAGAIRSAGGYLRAMVASARQGKLNLGAALWGTVDLAQRSPTPPSGDSLGTSQASPPPPKSTPAPLGEIMTQPVLTHICSTSPDPVGIEAVWRLLIARNRRWPRVEDVLREYGRTRSSSSGDLSRYPDTPR